MTQTEINAALFYDTDDVDFLTRSLACVPGMGRAVLVTDDAGLLPDFAATRRVQLEETALDQSPIDPEEVFVRLVPALGGDVGGLVVDMGWAVANLQAATSLESWGGVADRLARALGLPVVSIYNQDLTIEEMMQAAFRAHRQFLAPSGLHDNPYWIPADLLNGALLDDQLSFMLGRVVPDYADLRARRRTGQMNARGATPSWLVKPGALLGAQPGPARWHIHSLGPLQVFIGNRAVDWRIQGGGVQKDPDAVRLSVAKRRKGHPCRPHRRAVMARGRVRGHQAHPSAPHGCHAAQDAWCARFGGADGRILPPEPAARQLDRHRHL